VSTIQSQNYQAGADARYARAKRHSRRVRVLRIAVPAVVAAAMLAIVGISIFNPFRMLAKLPIDISGLAVSGSKITMELPHMAGFMSDQRPYELWAKSATQDVTTPNTVELQELRAKFQTEDNTGVTMDARNGVFDSKEQILDLADDIFVQSSTGYEARLTQANVDLKSGNLSSDQPVGVKLLNGTLDAKRLRITENGALVRFEGGVSMILVPDDPSKTDGKMDAKTDATKDATGIETAAPAQSPAQSNVPQ
jgi:lipopolysaccharide export system protein LptC